MDPNALNLLNFDMLHIVLGKVDNWELCHLRMASPFVDKFVENYENSFRRGIDVNLKVKSASPDTLQEKLSHGNRKAHLNSDQDQLITLAFKNITIKNFNVDLCKNAEAGPVNKVLEMVRNANVSCEKLNVWGAEADFIAELSDLLTCKRSIEVSVNTPDIKMFVEKLSEASTRSRIQLDVQKTLAMFTPPFFSHVKKFCGTFHMESVLPQELDDLLEDLCATQDKVNLEHIYLEAKWNLGQAAFFKNERVKVLWDKSSHTAQLKEPCPKSARKIDLPFQWAIVIEAPEQHTSRETIWVVENHFIPKNPKLLLNLLIKQGIVGKMNQEMKKEFYQAADQRREGIIKNCLATIENRFKTSDWH